MRIELIIYLKYINKTYQNRLIIGKYLLEKIHLIKF